MNAQELNESISKVASEFKNIELLTSDGNNYTWCAWKYDKTISLKKKDSTYLIRYFDVPRELELADNTEELETFIRSKMIETINLKEESK